jgi:hypothetical protein
MVFYIDQVSLLYNWFQTGKLVHRVGSNGSVKAAATRLPTFTYSRDRTVGATSGNTSQISEQVNELSFCN